MEAALQPDGGKDKCAYQNGDGNCNKGEKKLGHTGQPRNRGLVRANCGVGLTPLVRFAPCHLARDQFV